MKRKLFLTSILIGFLVGMSLVAEAQDPCPNNIRSIGDCPDTGCGRGGDAELNKMKNRTSNASNAQDRTPGQIRAMRQPRPWPTGQDRSSLASQENTAVVLRGYLHGARQSGSETTNCGLPRGENNDWHLDIVSRPNDPGGSAVSAEITPRVRKDGWTLAKLKHLSRERAYVRATGWLMLDTFHISRPLTRGTNWEVHPVTKFEICTSTRNDCIAGNGWKDLEDFEIPR